MNTYSAHSINDGGRTIWLLAIVDSGLLAHQCPEFVQVDGGAVSRVLLQVVVSHTHLTKVPWMAEKTQKRQNVQKLIQSISKFVVLHNSDRHIHNT